MILKFTFVFIVCCQLTNLITAEEVCPSGWEVYREQKCIKLFDTGELQSFAEAEQTCLKNGDAKLVTISFADKQQFIFNYLFTKKAVVNNVWLGAKYDSSARQFHWADSDFSRLTYANWAAKNPKNDSKIGQSCVQMYSEAELRGQWSNEPCTKKNLVLCERSQNWSNAKMQEQIVKIVLNQVPLGFTYVQLPKEKGPEEIWPWMIWTDVSSEYDSTFFRVAGTKAASFGAVQEEFSPYIDDVAYSDCVVVPGDECARVFPGNPWETKVPRSGWSQRVVTVNTNHEAPAPSRVLKGMMKFHTAAGEVRPKNMAVKVWKRIA